MNPASPSTRPHTNSPLYPPNSANNPPVEYHQAAAAAATANAALTQHHQHQQQHSPHTPTHSVPSPASTNGEPSKKRRSTGVPGSRGVANLTAEQLAKKRANDREAQRNIRIRTKNTIENLERRIKELESQQPYQELQRAIQERDRALNECEELRRRLVQVAGIVGGSQQPQTAPPGLNELATLTAQQSPLPAALHRHHQQQQQSHNQTPPEQPYPQDQAQGFEPPQQQIHPELRAPLLTNLSHSTAYRSRDEPARRPWSPSVSSEYASPEHSPYAHTRSPLGDRPPLKLETLQQRQREDSRGTVGAGVGERLGVSFLLDNSSRQQSHSPSQISKHVARTSAPSSAGDTFVPLFACLPRQSADSCPLDTLLRDFCEQRQNMLKSGAPGQNLFEAIGPAEPAYFAFLYPLSAGSGLSVTSSLSSFPNLPRERPPMHALSELLVTILEQYPDISRLPEKVAVLYVMFYVLRWRICPCRPCYERLPEWCRPTREQLEWEHPVWSDYLPWPHLRSQLAIANSPKRQGPEAASNDIDAKRPDTTATFGYNQAMPGSAPAWALAPTGSSSNAPRQTSFVDLDDFFIPYTTSLSLNWKLPEVEIFTMNRNTYAMSTTPDAFGAERSTSPPVTISPAFEAHVRNLDNWSLGMGFKNAFPGLVDERTRVEG